MTRKSMRFNHLLAIHLMVLAAAGLASCQTAQSEGYSHQPSVSSSSPSPAESQINDPSQPEGLLTGPVPEIAGPKRVVSVGNFDAIGAFTSKYGSWDVGGGLSAMMTTALVESNRFIVVERAQISQLLSEQEMKAGGVVNPETGPKLGQMSGVQFLIYGSVTEFGADDQGGGVSLGVSGGGLGNLLSGALSRQQASGSVGMDIRIVDTTTGQVIKTYRVREPVESSGWDISGGYRGISLGTNQFYKTPLGQAARRALTQAVRYIADEASHTPWVGRVVEVDGRSVIINAGSTAGVTMGDRFTIERIEKSFTDPQTGEVLGVKRNEVGTVQLKRVDAKMATGSFTPMGKAAPRRGDLVVLVR